jgi:hypothetical protein
MFRSSLIIFRELPNINKSYIKTWMDYWLPKHKLNFVLRCKVRSVNSVSFVVAFSFFFFLLPSDNDLMRPVSGDVVDTQTPLWPVSQTQITVFIPSLCLEDLRAVSILLLLCRYTAVTEFAILMGCLVV